MTNRRSGYPFAIRDAEFDWDDCKANSNRQDHGVTFEVARQVFDDPHALDEPSDDGDGDGEDRRQLIGATISGRLLFVAYTLRRSSDGRRRILIISARRANGYEQARYREEADRSRGHGAPKVAQWRNQGRGSARVMP